MGRGQEHPFHLPTPTTVSSRVFLVEAASYLLPAGSSLVRLPSTICATLSKESAGVNSQEEIIPSFPPCHFTCSGQQNKSMRPRPLSPTMESDLFSQRSPPVSAGFSSGSKGRSIAIGDAPDRVVRLVSRSMFVYRRGEMRYLPVPLSLVGTRSLPWGTTAHNLMRATSATATTSRNQGWSSADTVERRGD